MCALSPISGTLVVIIKEGSECCKWQHAGTRQRAVVHSRKWWPKGAIVPWLAMFGVRCAPD